jgi:thiamine-monophosphate kinase
MDLSKLGEFGWIERIRSRQKIKTPAGGLQLGIGDDCAVYAATPGKYQILSTDALVEGVHFRLATTTPEQLGRKTLAVNLSDIAAMGGTPTLAFLSIGLPPKTPLAFLDKFMSGLYAMARKHGVTLAGGDTVASPGPLILNIAIVGEVAKKRFFTRTGARPGDSIWVTGTLGSSALGLWLLGKKRPPLGWAKNPNHRLLIRRHLDPVPRLREAQWLAQSNIRITSMIDISDGLAQDLGHLCQGPRLGARLMEKHLPTSPALRRVCSSNRLNLLDFILYGGEDYELLFTTPGKDVKKLHAQFNKAGLPVALIGEITGSREKKMVLIDGTGRETSLPAHRGYDHFRSNP